MNRDLWVELIIVQSINYSDTIITESSLNLIKKINTHTDLIA